MMLYIIPYLFYSLLALIGIFLQAEFFSFLTIFGVKPDLLVIIAIMAGLHTDSKNGAVAGGVVGLWADLLAGGYFGIHILVYAFIGYLAGCIKHKNIFKTYPGYFFIVLLGSLLSGILFIICYSLVGANYPFWRNFTAIVIPYSFYNSLLLVLSFPFIFVYRRFRGLKIGYVDMFGAGIILISDNKKVDMKYVKERKTKAKSSRAKSKGTLFKQSGGGTKHGSKHDAGVNKDRSKAKNRTTVRKRDKKAERQAELSQFHNEGYYGPSYNDSYHYYSVRDHEDEEGNRNDFSKGNNKKKKKQDKSVKRNRRGRR